jgi:CspA family cold shock protein
MAQGTVKWFSEEKGYGFVCPDEGGEDLFVHYTAIEGSGFRGLNEGERISYEPARGRKGEQAENVRRVGPVDTDPRPPLALIHRSAWKGCSPEYGCRIPHSGPSRCPHFPRTAAHVRRRRMYLARRLDEYAGPWMFRGPAGEGGPALGKRSAPA